MFFMLNSLYNGFKAISFLLLIIFAVTLYTSYKTTGKNYNPHTKINGILTDQAHAHRRATLELQYEKKRLENSKAYLTFHQKRLAQINAKLSKQNLPQVISNLQGERKEIINNISNTQTLINTIKLNMKQHQKTLKRSL